MSIFQLRRIGLPPSVEDARSTYTIKGDSYIGRGKDVDIFLDSNIRKGLISRAHSHILKQTSEDGNDIYSLHDTSLNGTYVNDTRIKGPQVLKDGDRVVFGHLRGAIIDPGEYAPQNETEFLFLFEKTMKQEDDIDADVKEESSVFMSPNSLNTDAVGLPGLLSTINHPDRSSSTSESISKKVLRDSGLCSSKSQDDESDELHSIISNVTSKILNDDKAGTSDSFNLDLKITSNENRPPPNHPRNGLLSNLLNPSDSPKSFTSITDPDIKRDTSLNITHVYEHVEPKYLTDALRTKVRNVLREHDTKQTINNELHKRHEIVIPLDEDDKEDSESIFSDKSEEILDSDSDSDFVPSKSDSEAEMFTEPKRTRKTPQRFSPKAGKAKRRKTIETKTPKVLKTKVSESKTPTSTPQTRRPLGRQKGTKVGNKFVHDKCAAWDCMRPSAAIKQITWVACDDCDAWYHVSCSGLSASDAMKPDTKYHCGCG